MPRGLRFSLLVTSILGVLSSAATAEPRLTVTFTTTGVGGLYAPLNCQAVWVESEEAQFIKTIGRWCTTTVAGVGESEHLVAWRNKSGLGDIDGVSGATRLDHGGQLVAAWDLKDKEGVVVPDGIYRVRFENADSNSTTQGQNAQSVFTFTKGPATDIRPAQTDPAATPTGTSPTVDVDYNPRALECDNGIVDPGETCDPPGSCPVECVSNKSCVSSVMSGTAATCNAQCIVTNITECVNGDGCCADGCTENNDTDCDLSSNFGGCASTDGSAGVIVFGLLFVGLTTGLRARRRAA